MSPLPLVAVAAHLGLYAGLLAFGFLVGAFGHIIGSRATIITGIALVGLVSAYFTVVVLHPFSGS